MQIIKNKHLTDKDKNNIYHESIPSSGNTEKLISRYENTLNLNGYLIEPNSQVINNTNKKN